MPLPQRPKQHVIGELGQDEAAIVFKRWGWTAARVEPDYGEDLACNIFVDGFRTNLYFRCQVKSKDGDSNYVRELASGDFAVSIDTTTLRTWLSSLFPVLLIVYDESSRDLYWTDATHQILESIDKLEQGSATLRIKRSSHLRDHRLQVQGSVQKFYQNLLRLSKPAVESVAYPILMPKYRAASSLDIVRLHHDESSEDPSSDDVRIETLGFSVDSLPAWTAALQTLSHERAIPGAIVRAPLTDLDSLAVLIRRLVLRFAEVVRPDADEWLSVAFGPSHLVALSGEASEETAWNRELAGWRSYSVINSRTVADFDYAFAVPNGFSRGHRVRSFSWDGTYYLNREQDIVLQMSARVSSTPADRMLYVTRRQQLKNNFAPWICARHEVDVVHEAVSAVGLAFAEVESFSVAEGEVAGIIQEPFFNPVLGLSAMSMNWAEYDRGSVHERLCRANLVDNLPGRLGPRELTDFVLERCPGSYQEVPDRFQISVDQCAPGMPIDHSGRIVTLQRFGECSAQQAQAGRKKLERLRVLLTSSGLAEECLAADVIQVDIISNRSLFEASVSWRPLLSDSLTETVDKVLPLAVETFQQVLPSALDGGRHDGRFGSSYDVLYLLGQIVFEGIDVG